MRIGSTVTTLLDYVVKDRVLILDEDSVIKKINLGRVLIEVRTSKKSEARQSREYQHGVSHLSYSNMNMLLHVVSVRQTLNL